MRQKRTPIEIQDWLTTQGLGANPIEKIIHRDNGDTEIWLIGLAGPVIYAAPRRRRAPRKRSKPNEQAD